MFAKEKKQRITKQRKVILNELREVCIHPTAKQIYKLAKKQLPNISLATIYRNLEYLEENNLIIKIKSKRDEYRYDGNISDHCHLICSKCGKIIDIFDLKELSFCSKKIKESGFIINSEFVELHGTCKKCQE